MKRKECELAIHYLEIHSEDYANKENDIKVIKDLIEEHFKEEKRC